MGDFLDVCAAITGRAPLAGFHLPENRTDSLLVRVPPTDRPDGSFYTALGYLVGKDAGDLVPVIDGIADTPSTEDLKAFCAAVATSGPVGMFHMVGVTPEAPTREAAFGGRTPLQTLDVRIGDLVETMRSLSTGEAGSALDLVVMGSPHFTLGDFAELAELVEGRTRDSRVDVLITTSRFVLDHAVRLGWARIIEEFGGRFSTDTCLCMLNPDMLAPGTRTVMTNSGKFAHYGPGLVRRGVWFGTLGDCVESAVTGTPAPARLGGLLSGSPLRRPGSLIGDIFPTKGRVTPSDADECASGPAAGPPARGEAGRRTGRALPRRPGQGRWPARA
jgi:predicted aconitase